MENSHTLREGYGSSITSGGGGGKMSSLRSNPYRRERRETSIPSMAASHSKSSPRQLRIERKDNGFGFTLRHFIVYPPEDGGDATGPPIQEPMDTIFVKSVKHEGPAVEAGLNIGDRIVSVNGESVSGRSYAQVVQMIQKSRDSLFVVVVPKQDDILQVYFSDIAQNPESNKRQEGGGGGGPGKPPWPASVCSSSSRESSPFSSKTSDSARDSVYGYRQQAGERSEERNRLREPADHIYDTIGARRAERAERADRLSQYSNLTVPLSSHSSSSEHLYAAIPAMASSSRSSSSTLLSAGHHSTARHSRDSLDSDSSALAGFTGQERAVDRIRRDCSRKKEFLESQTYPAYLSSPPKDVDNNPRGIANLATTMPPSIVKDLEPPKAAKNFFMDIYAQEMSKMQTSAKSSSQSKKRNFDASQFNAYGLPLGYRKGGYFDTSSVDAFSRNNYVIVGSRTLHCEPPQVYQPTPEPATPPTFNDCYGEYGYHHHPAVPQVPVCPPCPACSPCPACTMISMTSPASLQPRASRPTTLPGIQSLHSYRAGVGGHQDSLHHLSPVHMHPDPDTITHRHQHRNTVVDLEPHPHSTHYASWPASRPGPAHNNISIRRKNFASSAENEDEKNLRRISYLQATKVERMEVEENDKNDPNQVQPQPQTVTTKSDPSIIQSDQSEQSPTEEEKEKIKEGYLTCKVACLDGRKANDRSWKTVYAVLKSKVLYMYKDKKMALDNLEYEEKPLKLVESEVEVASDYTKRKNVFRVKTDGGSEYLFQAENDSEMKVWVNSIEVAATAIIVDERKDNNKLIKLPFRNRSPSGQSPASKSRKSSAEVIPPYKDKKTWKGKVVNKLKRIGGASHGPLYPEGGSIGVPIDECPICPSCSEPSSSGCTICVPLVPYLVKICCDIVNERGLDIVGIYRVPGNNAAVTYLTEQINKGVECFAMEDQRWQDINVVSSLLKSFFRKLPDPLFTTEMYALFIEASKVDQAGRRMDQLRKLIKDLPAFHFETLKYVTNHLCQVAEHSSVNKMEVRNLAIVFGPTLVRTSDDNMVSMVTDMSQQCRIIESLLSNWEYFFTEEEVEVKDDGDDGHNLATGSNNQSLMLENLQKLEEAGKVGSPKGDVSAKDIVSSIISAANRKMLKAASGKTKKESSVECESERGSSVTRGDSSDGIRRESESVIHGALQIASAVPGILANKESVEREMDSEPERQYSRNNSLCLSKRGSICEYTGGTVHEDLCASRVALMRQDSSEVANGHEESEQVLTGTLSLVNVPGYPLVVSSAVSPGDSSVSCVVSNTLTVAGAIIRPESVPAEHKFPIETYVGLEKETAERVAKFEAETKAMLTQRSGLARSSQDIREAVTTSHRHVYESCPGRSSPSSSLSSNSISSLLSQDSQSLSRTLSSLTTPVPESNPLDGGILVEEPYSTEAYNLPKVPSQRRFLDLTYRASLPNLQPAQDSPSSGADLLSKFDTNKIATKGTLQRMKMKSRGELQASLCLEATLTGSESEGDIDVADTEKLLNTLTESFDMKMRLLLDPHYQSGSNLAGDSNSQGRMVLDNELIQYSGINKKKIDEAKNMIQQAKSARRVELKRSPRVDKNIERRARGPELGVLKQVNTKRQLDRSNSLTKQEKTELNLKAKAVEKENTVAFLKNQFEKLGNSENISKQKMDMTKLRKKLSECKNRRIQRRHTVGGTKDFSGSVVSLLVRGVSAWDRLAPITIISDTNLDMEDERRLSLQFEEERRLSLPTVESSV